MRPLLAEALVTEAAWRRLEGIACCFPGDVLAALELRVAEGERQVDLSVRLATPSQAHAAAGLGISKPVRAVLERWSLSTAVRAQIPAIWLEHDLDPEAEGLPEPLVCLQVAPAFDPTTLDTDLLPALLGTPLTPSQHRALERCGSSAGISGRLLYVFSLGARGSRALRLEILGHDTAESLRDLERLTGTAANDPLAEAAALLQAVERPHLSFDVETDVLPRIGLEGSFRRLPHREPRWAELFARLVSAGLCTAEKRAAVLAWPGYDTPRTAAERWPLAVPRGGCVRSLSHVKLVAEPGRPLEAKAYLTFQHLERARASAAPPAG